MGTVCDCGLRPWALATVRAMIDHLSEDELDRYLDGDLDSAERHRADAHLRTVSDCRSWLRRCSDAQSRCCATCRRSMCRARSNSVRISPAGLPMGSVGSLLLPMLPAIEATTVTLLLMLGGITAYRVADDQAVIRSGLGADGPCCDDHVIAATRFAATNAPAITETPMPILPKRRQPPTDSASQIPATNAACRSIGRWSRRATQSEPGESEAPTTSSADQSAISRDSCRSGPARAPTGATDDHHPARRRTPRS